MKKTIVFICLMMLSGCAILGDKLVKLEREVARVTDDVCDFLPASDVEQFVDGVNKNLSRNRAILVDCGGN